MTDYEMTRLCAEAMGYSPTIFTVAMPDLALSPSAMWVDGVVNKGCSVYDPLEDDAQAMALVKKFGLDIEAPRELSNSSWEVYRNDELSTEITTSDDLNRAIVECIAKRQQAK